MHWETYNNFQVAKKSRNTDTAKWENKSISHTEMNNNMLRYKIN